MNKTSGGFLKKQRLHLLLLVFLGLLIYSNTFVAPFQFDDLLFVDYREVESKMAEATNSIFTASELRGPWASRPLLYTTFLLNHLLGDFNTWGYHIINIALHVSNGILLYFLVAMTGRHLGREEKEVVPVALISALIFVLHPVQTEALDMVINRSMLMAATFFLLGLIMFLKSITSSGRRKLYFTMGLLASALLGAASREDFATFPIVLFAYDLLLLSRFRVKEAAGHYKQYAAVIPGTILIGFLALTNTYDKFAEFAGHELPPEILIPPLNYALTQLKVHWTYIRLLLLPINQNLDYSYPISQSLFQLPTILAFLGYIGLWGAGIFFARRKPAVSLGLLWFLIILLPISFGVTVLGLRLGDPIFEHRFYLPSIGLIVLAALAMARSLRKRAFLIPAVAVLCVTLGSATYARNNVWTDVERLWKDVLSKSPDSERAHINIAAILNNRRHTNEAIEHLQKALEIWPDSGEAYNNLGVVYMNKRDVDKAIEYLEKAVEIAPSLARSHSNLGLAYATKEEYEKALEQYLAAAHLEPWQAPHLNHVAETYYALGEKEKAIEFYSSSLWLDKKQKRVLNNLGLLFVETGQKVRAIKHLEALVKLEPDFAPPRITLGKLYIEKQMPYNAVQHLLVAQKLLPEEPEIHSLLAEAYTEAGDKLSAEEHRELAGKLKASESSHKASGTPQD